MEALPRNGLIGKQNGNKMRNTYSYWYQQHKETKPEHTSNRSNIQYLQKSKCSLKALVVSANTLKFVEYLLEI